MKHLLLLTTSEVNFLLACRERYIETSTSVHLKRMEEVIDDTYYKLTYSPTVKGNDVLNLEYQKGPEGKPEEEVHIKPARLVKVGEALEFALSGRPLWVRLLVTMTEKGHPSGGGWSDCVSERKVEFTCTTDMDAGKLRYLKDRSLNLDLMSPMNGECDFYIEKGSWARIYTSKPLAFPTMEEQFMAKLPPGKQL